MPAPLAADLLARGVATDIRHLDAASVAALKPVMIEAQREIAADLAAWVTRLGPNAASLAYTPAHLQQLRVLLGVAQGQADNRRGGFPRAAQSAVLQVMNQQQAPRRAAQTVIDQLDQLAQRFSDMPPPQLLHAAIIARGDRMVANRYPSSAARYAGHVKQDLQHQLAVGLAKGETVQRLANRLAKLSSFQGAVDLSHPTHAAGAVAGGLVGRYERWGERLVRTELTNAYNYTAHQGIIAASKLDQRVVMRWDSTNDLRRCTRCAAMDGETADPVKGFAGVLPHPPLHPNCRCSIIAWMAEWADDHVPAARVEEIDRVRARAARAENEAVKRVERQEVRREVRARRKIDRPGKARPGAG